MKIGDEVRRKGNTRFTCGRLEAIHMYYDPDGNVGSRDRIAVVELDGVRQCYDLSSLEAALPKAVHVTAEPGQRVVIEVVGRPAPIEVDIK